MRISLGAVSALHCEMPLNLVFKSTREKCRFSAKAKRPKVNFARDLGSSSVSCRIVSRRVGTSRSATSAAPDRQRPLRATSVRAAHEADARNIY